MNQFATANVTRLDPKELSDALDLAMRTREESESAESRLQRLYAARILEIAGASKVHVGTGAKIETNLGESIEVNFNTANSLVMTFGFGSSGLRVCYQVELDPMHRHIQLIARRHGSVECISGKVEQNIALAEVLRLADRVLKSPNASWT